MDEITKLRKIISVQKIIEHIDMDDIIRQKQGIDAVYQSLAEMFKTK